MFSTRTAHSADCSILQSFRFVRLAEIRGNSTALFLLTIPNLRDDTWVIFSQGSCSFAWRTAVAALWIRTCLASLRIFTQAAIRISTGTECYLLLLPDQAKVTLLTAIAVPR